MKWWETPRRSSICVGRAVHMLTALILALMTGHAIRTNPQPIASEPVHPFHRPFYTPWLYFWFYLSLLILIRHAARGLRAWMGPRIAGWDGKTLPKWIHRFGNWVKSFGASAFPKKNRAGFGHLLLVIVLFVGSYGVLDAYRMKANPHSAVIGMDNPAFISNIAAVAEAKWDIYNKDKRMMWARICLQVSRWTGQPYHEAAQWVSLVSIASLAPLTYLGALPLLGRLGALLAAIVTLSSPQLHPFAIQTTSYAFFFATVLLALSVGIWTVATRAAWMYAATGLALSLCIATQIKGITIALPIIGLALVAGLTTGARGMAVRTLLLLIPLAVNQWMIDNAPVRYTGMAKLAAIHRFEVNHGLRYQWPQVKKPNPSEPSPVSKWLPSFLKGGEFEALLAVTTTPPDSDVIVFEPTGPDPHAPLRPRIMKETSIPPTAVRLKHNLKAMEPEFRQTWPMLMALLGFGVSILVIPFPRSTLGIPRLGGWLVAAVLASLFGTLSLKYNIRYVAFAIPAAAICLVVGIAIPARQWTRFQGTWRIATDIVITWFTLSVALMIFTQSGSAYLSRGISWKRLASYLHTPRLHPRIQQAEGYLMVADWLRDNLTPDDRIVDCSPIPVWVYLAGDPRLVPFEGGESPRQERCLRLLAEGHVPTHVYIVISNVMEYRTPQSPRISLFFERPDVWEPVFHVNTRTHDTSMPTRPYHSDPGDVMVFRGRGDAEQRVQEENTPTGSETRQENPPQEDRSPR